MLVIPPTNGREPRWIIRPSAQAVSVAIMAASLAVAVGRIFRPPINAKPVTENRQLANPYVEIPIATGIGYARNAAVVKSAQAVIAVGGSYGTLTEIGYALQSGLPVIGLNTWTISRNDRQDKSIIPAESPAEAVRLALELASD